MENNTSKKKNLAAMIIMLVILGFLLPFGIVVFFKSFTIVNNGYEGVVYSLNGGVKNNTLSQGCHFITPFTQKVRQFTVSNEQLVLTKDKRDGSKEDDSFKVSTSDNASIAISFQMSYRFRSDVLVDTYKKFRGLDGEDIVNKRVRTVLKSRISEITTDYSMMDIYSGNRAEINTKLTEYLNTQFSTDFGIEVLDASIVDVHPDDKLTEAIEARVQALQEKQKAEAAQQTAKVEAETKLIKAKNEAEINVTKAEAEAEIMLRKAEAEAKANKLKSASITDELIRMKEAEARLEHGWVTIQSGEKTTVVVDEEKDNK